MQTEFIASLADTSSAIKVGSDGMKIQLDIPESEVEQALQLVGMRRRALQVTVSLASAPAPATAAPEGQK